MHKNTGRRGVFLVKQFSSFKQLPNFSGGPWEKCILGQNLPTLGPCPLKDTCISYIMQINHPNTWAETFLVDFIEKSQPFQDGACCHDLDAPGVVRSLWHFFDLVIWMPTFFEKKHRPLEHTQVRRSKDSLHQQVVKGLWYVPGVGWGNFLETWMPSSTFAKSLSFIYYLIWNLNRKYQHKHSLPASHCWLGKKVANTPPYHTIPTEICDFSKFFLNKRLTY